MKQETKDRLIALVLTLLLLGAVTAVLCVGSISWTAEEMAAASTPEISMVQEDETFIEPEIVPDPGEADVDEEGEPAPALQGEPEKAPVENDRVNVNGPSEKPAPPIAKPVTQTKPSPVQATTPPKTDKPDSKVTKSVADAFSGRNGAADGKPAGSGSGTTGNANAHGSMKGRSMLSCPKPDVALKKRVTITVNITVNEAGHVTSAKAVGGDAQYLRDACVAAAKRSTWTPQKGAGEARGTITFTITPR